MLYPDLIKAKGMTYRYLKVHGPQELGLYRVSGSTSVVDEMRADFINSELTYTIWIQKRNANNK